MKFDFVRLTINGKTCITNMAFFDGVWSSVNSAVQPLNISHLGSTRQKMKFLHNGTKRTFSHQEVIIEVERKDFGWEADDNYRREYRVKVSHRQTKANFSFKFVRTGPWMKDETLNRFDFKLVNAEGELETITELANTLENAWLNAQKI